MSYLASGVFWIIDTEVGLLRLAGDLAGDVAMSFLGRFKDSVEKCKLLYECYIKSSKGKTQLYAALH